MQTLGQFTNQTDIGDILHAGTCQYDAASQSYTIAGAGDDMWFAHDDCTFVWRRHNGNLITTARAAFTGDAVHIRRKFGWMARAGLALDDAFVAAVVHGNGILALQFRRAKGAMLEEVRMPLVGADVFQLERNGDSWIMSAAQHGQPFTSARIDGVALAGDLHLGLFVCSHAADHIEPLRADNVRIVTPAGPEFVRFKDPFGSNLEVLDVETGARAIVYSSDDVFEAPNWTHDGAALIYNADGRLVRFDLASGVNTLIDTGACVHNNNDHVISFDGAMLAISDMNAAMTESRIYTVPVGGGAPNLVTPLSPSFLHGWSPDGKYLVYAAYRNGDFDVYRIPAGGGEEVRLTDAPGLDDGPEYTPDGRFIYFNSVRNGGMQIWRMLADGSDQQQLTVDEYNNWFAHISPDGGRLAFVSYLPGEAEPGDHPAAKRCYLRMTPLHGGAIKVIAYLYGGQGSMNVPSWSPDGRRLAFVSNSVPPM